MKNFLAASGACLLFIVIFDIIVDLIGLKIDLISYIEGCFATGIYILVREWE